AEARNAGTDGDDRAGEVVTEDERCPHRQDRLEVAVTDLEIDRVDARRVNPDEDFMGAWLRVRHVAGAHGVGVAVALDHKCLHRFLRLWPVGRTNKRSNYSRNTIRWDDRRKQAAG